MTTFEPAELTAAPGVGPADLVCPGDGGPLHWDEAGIACLQCGRQWDRVGRIPVFESVEPDDLELEGDAEPDLAGADWRFLTPLDEASRVLDLGAGAGATTLAVAPEVELVAASDRSLDRVLALAARAKRMNLDNVALFVAAADVIPFPDRTFDLIALNDPVAGDPTPGSRRADDGTQRFFERIWSKLAPGGRVWFETSNRWALPILVDGERAVRPARVAHGLHGWRKALRGIGFDRIDFWAPLRSLGSSKVFVPLDRPAAFEFILDRTPAGTRGRLRRTLEKWAFRSGLLPRVVPSFAVLARKPPHSATSRSSTVSSPTLSRFA